jgi:hypothetical protein
MQQDITAQQGREILSRAVQACSLINPEGAGIQFVYP